MRKLHYVGLDVHARTISVAVADEDGVKSLGTLEHDVPKLGKLLRKVGPKKSVKVVYEAGPTGYGLCRALRADGYECEVVAPSLIPSRPGDRVKTDRRDAENLAQLSRGQMLTSVWVPETRQEALRDLVRAREAAKSWERKAGQQLTKFLLRHNRRPVERMTNWTEKHLAWLRSQTFDEPAQELVFAEYIAEYEHQRDRVKRIESHLQEVYTKLPQEYQVVIRALEALKGVRFLTAITLVSEIGDMMRFSHPTQLMSYAGVVPREHSSGDKVRRGSISKSGNAHLRRVLGESAWAYGRGRSTPSIVIRRRRENLSPAVVTIAERADKRLHRRYRVLTAKGKHRNKVITAISRELLGFVWAIGVEAHKAHATTKTKTAA